MSEENPGVSEIISRLTPQHKEILNAIGGARIGEIATYKKMEPIQVERILDSAVKIIGAPNSNIALLFGMQHGVVDHEKRDDRPELNQRQQDILREIPWHEDASGVAIKLGIRVNMVRHTLQDLRSLLKLDARATPTEVVFSAVEYGLLNPADYTKEVLQSS